MRHTRVRLNAQVLADVNRANKMLKVDDLRRSFVAFARVAFKIETFQGLVVTLNCPSLQFFSPINLVFLRHTQAKAFDKIKM